ncbi:MAG: hypothetical protein LUQ50_09835 [Methanospirillum sp.]|uniref:hypothetical protein n=1 Tax=Methanospirillum sp. TaxID=45200 RepID=UPI002372865F|nr:hypothetical protein [Methanospirillum sp.]MDD1729356.1 hypothetical protein [Methanospirillum sp.]
MTKKEKCQELMGSIFGPASAKLVLTMSEDNCVERCREKVAAFFGEEKAKEFDSIRG